MSDFFSKLEPSDWITFWGIIVTLVFSVISVIIAISTLKQNSRMIEESTRPNIVIYFDIVYVGSQVEFFIIKNFGQTGGYITNFVYPDILKQPSHNYSSLAIQQFENIKGLYLAPGQKISIKCFELPNEADKLDFSLEYNAGKKKYKEEISLSVKDTPQHIHIRNDCKEPLMIIAKALQETTERIV